MAWLVSRTSLAKRLVTASCHTARAAHAARSSPSMLLHGIHHPSLRSYATASLAQNVKALRAATGLPMKVCRKALEENSNDLDTAMEYIKENEAARAKKAQDKLADRSTNEGRVGVLVSNTQGAMIKLSCETDFVARNEVVEQLASELASVVASQGSGDNTTDEMLDFSMPNGGTVRDEISKAIATVGENIVLQDAASLRIDSGVIGSYTYKHGAYAAIVGLECKATDEAKSLANKLAQHLVAVSPYVDDTAEATEVFMGSPFLFNDSHTVREQVLSGEIDCLGLKFLRWGVKDPSQKVLEIKV